MRVSTRASVLLTLVTIQVVLLDHGLYISLSQATRTAFRDLWRAMVMKDDDELRRYQHFLRHATLSRRCLSVVFAGLPLI